MSTKTKHAILSSEITPEAVYRDRRRFMQAGVAAAGLAGLGLSPSVSAVPTLGKIVSSAYRLEDEEHTDYEDITSYNNFYEFGTGKDQPARRAHTLKVHPWSVSIGGECNKPGVYDLDEILRPHTLEDRVYRFRCVEGWSMVIPWVGFPLAGLLQRFEPNSKAKYVRFETLYDPKQMPGQKSRILDWPYVEGLRMDEAMHPLTLMAVGLYGKALPKQNGAPLRLVVPWKYGFKSIKSIVKISFEERQPQSSWMKAALSEYGFYSNVNPQVDHPRWSQRTERRIGEFRKRRTLPFNGYADEVASLYAGMDLKKYF